PDLTISFLSRCVSLLPVGQSRQHVYEIDSKYYEIDRFSEYVRDGLASLTLEDVNRVIRENLDTEQMQYVFVAKDANDLRQRLIDDSPSPITYESEKPEELLQEDSEIAALPLNVEAEAVRVVPASEVFSGNGESS